MHVALKLAISPLLIAQAVRTRRRALVMPEAAGPRQGVAAGGAGAGTALPPPHGLRILVAGDSSAAGVGVDQQERAFAGQLARALHARLGVPVAWRLQARSGLTTRGVHRLLEASPPPAADVAVIVSGVNDVVDQLPVRRALRHRMALAAWLLDGGRARHVVFAPLPPIDRFPLLPEPLRAVLGADARRHDAALAEWARDRERVTHAPFEVELDATSMAADGFHPGEPVYLACGVAIAAHVEGAVWPKLMMAEQNAAQPHAPDGARGGRGAPSRPGPSSVSEERA
jgi:lysophospholipase L1-like esterase